MPGDTPLKQRLDFLDVARGMAAMFVLAEHGLNICLPGFLSALLGHGHLGRAGVFLFLLISGFIIPSSLEQGGSNARFWLRRCFRLFPAYWLSIVLAFGCYWSTGHAGPGAQRLEAEDWLLNLTMLQGFFGRPHVWAVFWTLQLELVIYIACSLLFSTRLLSRSMLIGVLVLAGYAAVGFGRPLLEGKPFAVGGERFLYFAPLLGLIAQRFWAGSLRRQVFIMFVLGQAILFVAVWWVNHLCLPERMTVECLWELVCTWGIACACFLLLLGARRWAMPQSACWLGRISYSVYLLHPFVLVVLTPMQLQAWAFLPALVAGALVLAELNYRFVELPGIALGRALERRWWRAHSEPCGVSTVLVRAA